MDYFFYSVIKSAYWLETFALHSSQFSHRMVCDDSDIFTYSNRLTDRNWSLQIVSKQHTITLEGWKWFFSIHFQIVFEFRRRRRRRTFHIKSTAYDNVDGDKSGSGGNVSARAEATTATTHNTREIRTQPLFLHTAVIYVLYLHLVDWLVLFNGVVLTNMITLWKTTFPQTQTRAHSTCAQNSCYNRDTTMLIHFAGLDEI